MIEPTDGCLACDTLTGKIGAPGGLVADGGPWVADHCLGPFGVGAFVAKTRAHRPSLWELSDEESAAMGPFLTALSGAMIDALDAERVYLSMWVDAQPHHVHLVLEPRYRDRVEADGAKARQLQEWRRRRGPPDPNAASAAAEAVRNALVNRQPSYVPRRRSSQFAATEPSLSQ